MLKNKVSLLNILSGILLQFCAILSGFIVPKLILMCFGSEVNGLVSSVGQFLGYIQLVEGGITGVVTANLYKPLVNHDEVWLSSVIVTADRFFKKIGLIFIGYTVLVAVLYPLLFDVKFSFAFVFFLTLILSFSMFVQYVFALSLRTVLNADRKGYIVNFVQSVLTIANITLATISVNIFPSIHVLKAISGLLFVLQPIVFRSYINKHYSIDWNAKSDNSLLKERWDGFAINLAAFIHGNTDVALLTIFASLETVSVYSVYSIVCAGVKMVVQSCLSGISHNVGQAYARNDFDEVNRKLDIYEYIVFVLITFFFTVAILLITPFVQLYTNGINDADYYQPVFGVLLLVAEALYIVKIPHLDLAYAANKFKEITPAAIGEAALNIIISIALVNKYRLIGVAIGTIVGMVWRMVFHIYYTTKLVPGRGQGVFYKRFIIFIVTASIGVALCCTFAPMKDITVLNWISHGFIYSAIVGCLIIICSCIFFKKELKFFLNYLK